MERIKAEGGFPYRESGDYLRKRGVAPKAHLLG